MTESKTRQNRDNGKRPPDKRKSKTNSGLSKKTIIITISAVVVIILAIIGIIGYPIYVAPFHKTIISVDNVNISMDYFLKRIELSGSDPIAEITNLTNDQIIKLGVPKIQGISPVTANDVDQYLKSVFEGQTSSSNNPSGNITNGLNDLSSFTPAKEAEFKEWYRQLLNNSKLSDKQYQDIVTIEILRSRLQTYLEAGMPTSAEQAHVYIITTETEQQATDARARWAAGEDFSALAKELSVDTTSATKGGELGWFPKGGVLIPSLEDQVFTLTTGNVSDPIPVVDDVAQSDGSTAPQVVGYNLLLVTERAVRPLDDVAIQALQSKLVDNWLADVRGEYNIKWYGLKNGFDSETYAWIKYQMAKAHPSSASTTSSGSGN